MAEASAILQKNPWCGDFVETCIRAALPDEPLPGALGINPYWARNWLLFGQELIRQVLTVAGTALVAKGYIEASDVEPVIGALLTIGSVVWSVSDKRAR